MAATQRIVEEPRGTVQQLADAELARVQQNPRTTGSERGNGRSSGTQVSGATRIRGGAPRVK